MTFAVDMRDAVGGSICDRCILRYQVDPVKLELFEIREENEVKGCIGCFGILSDASLHEIADSCAKLLKESDYIGCQFFNLSIFLPHCVTVRQYTLSALLKEKGVKYKEAYLLRDFLKGSSDILSIIRLSIKQKNKCRHVCVKDALRYACKALIEKQTGLKICCKEDTDLMITLVVMHSTNKTEMQKLEKSLPNKAKRRKYHNRRKDVTSNETKESKYRIEGVIKFLDEMDEKNIAKYCIYPPTAVTEPPSFDMSTCRKATLLAGRYNKFSRELSQTPWKIEGKRKTNSSVEEEIIEKLKLASRPKSAKFISAGREDVDVMMLGRGRPFAVELTDPKGALLTNEDLRMLQKDINASTDLIKVSHLQLIIRADLSKIKDGEQEKTKIYKATIWSETPLDDEKINQVNGLKNVELEQKTPIRVLHRRPLLSRTKMIYSMELKHSHETFYELILHAQAGTYIKEFVHGDFSRTMPNMRTLLARDDVEIDQLDVQEVLLDWPPELPEDNQLNS